jgi:hypothetical protein
VVAVQTTTATAEILAGSTLGCQFTADKALNFQVLEQSLRKNQLSGQSILKSLRKVDSKGIVFGIQPILFKSRGTELAHLDHSHISSRKVVASSSKSPT